MTKDKSARMKHWYIAISLMLNGSGMIWKAYNHFAKTTTVEAVAKSVVAVEEAATKGLEWVQERLHIGTLDDRVLRKESDVERAKNHLRFEQKSGAPTIREEEEVKIQEQQLEKAVKEREELIRQYESKK